MEPSVLESSLNKHKYVSSTKLKRSQLVYLQNIYMHMIKSHQDTILNMH